MGELKELKKLKKMYGERAIERYGKDIARNVRHLAIDLMLKHIVRTKNGVTFFDLDKAQRDIMNIQFPSVDPLAKAPLGEAIVVLIENDD